MAVNCCLTSIFNFFCLFNTFEGINIILFMQMFVLSYNTIIRY